MSRDLKSQIMSMIADSSESLPLHTVDESDEDTTDDTKLAPPTTNGAAASSKLASEPLNSADIATPTPEKPNPLEQVPTARDEADGATASRATTASATPSRPGMDKRQSTMKRISSAFKRTVSKNQ